MKRKDVLEFLQPTLSYWGLTDMDVLNVELHPQGYVLEVLYRVDGEIMVNQARDGAETFQIAIDYEDNICSCCEGDDMT